MEKKKTKYTITLDKLKDDILNGAYKNEELLPPENNLCEKYKISRLTLKKVTDKLVSEGLLFKKRGAGTYINTLSLSLLKIKGNHHAGFTGENKDANISTKILHFSIIPANKEISLNLSISEGDFIYDVLRVRYIDNNPIVLEQDYYPINVITGLSLNIIKESIYNYIENDLNLKIKTFNQAIYSEQSEKLDMEELKLKKNEPVSIVKQIAFLDNGIPFEYSISRYRFDKFIYNSVSIKG